MRNHREAAFADRLKKTGKVFLQSLEWLFSFSLLWFARTTSGDVESLRFSFAYFRVDE
jgi:hypothetical protein